MMVGICGGCRREELCNIKMKDTEYQGDIILILLTKNYLPRKFVIDKECIFKKYASIRPIRPEKIETERLFLKYGKEECIVYTK